ncbi:MAG: 4Fe-4S binding protein [Armatimonadetes bacterium]|nr:4Fe-4S binding protein [Armatimonadota bacterium]
MSSPPPTPLDPGIALRLDAPQCVGCAICADVCPTRALVLTPVDLLPVWLPEACTACRICERQCPTAAITVQGRPRRRAAPSARPAATAGAAALPGPRDAT